MNHACCVPQPHVPQPLQVFIALLCSHIKHVLMKKCIKDNKSKSYQLVANNYEKAFMIVITNSYKLKNVFVLFFF